MPGAEKISYERAVIPHAAGPGTVGDSRRLHDGGVASHVVDYADETVVEDVEALAEEGVEAWAVGAIGHPPVTTIDAVSGTALLHPANLADGAARGRLVLVETPVPLPPPSATVPRPDPGAAGWTAVSLFCGLGGLDLGFALEGCQATGAYDNSPSAVSTYNRNLHPAARIADLGSGPCPPAHADLLLAGAPCQGFSTVGKRDLDDPRSDLLSRVGDAAAAVAPRVIVIENVPAAAVGAHGARWRLLEQRLRWSGYNVRRVTADGRETGLAQHRRRLFMVCWRGSEHRRLVLPPIPAVGLPSALSMLEGLSGHEPRQLTNPTKLAIARRIAAGQKLSNVRMGDRNVASWDIPEAHGPTSHEERRLLVLVARMRRRSRPRDYGEGDPISRAALSAAFGRDPTAEIDRLLSVGYLRDRDGLIDLRHTYNGKYRRLHWDMPAPTVDTHFGRTSNFLHPTQHRGMTLREAMRLQGLPDWYSVSGSREDTFRLVGNAVPPPMAAAVAWSVREALLKD